MSNYEDLNINNAPLPPSLQTKKKHPNQVDFEKMDISDEIFDDIKNIKYTDIYIELEKKFYQSLEEKIKIFIKEERFHYNPRFKDYIITWGVSRTYQYYPDMKIIKIGNNYMSGLAGLGWELTDNHLELSKELDLEFDRAKIRALKSKFEDILNDQCYIN